MQSHSPSSDSSREADDGSQSQQRSLKRTAIVGTAWTTAGFGLGQVLRLVSNVILAAVLEQEAFALMAIVGAIVQGLTMFSDIGLGPSIVQNARGDDQDFLDTAWTLQVIRGVFLALVAGAAAWPLAAFYSVNDPLAVELRYLLPIVALGTACEGFQSTKLRTASRHLQLRRVTVLEFSAQLIGLVAIVGFALLTRSVYAIAFGSLVGMVAHTTLTHVGISGPRNHFRWDTKTAREIARFGKWIFASTAVTFLAMQLDKLVFARLFPLDEVGVYSIAASLALLTPTLMGRVQSAVAFPLYARMIELKTSLASIVASTKEPMLVLGGYIVALSIAGAQSFVEFLYDERYVAAGIYIPILAAGAWFTMLEGIYGAAFLASGRPQWVAIANAVKVVCFCLIIGPMAHLWGFVGAVCAVAVSDLGKFVGALVGARRVGLRSHGLELAFTAFVAAVGLGTMAGVRVGPRALRELPVLALVVEFVLVTASFLPFALRAFRRMKARKAAETAELAPPVAA